MSICTKMLQLTSLRLQIYYTV